MSMDAVRDLLLWCAVLNYLFLLLWFVIFALAHDWIRRLHGRWFALSADRFDAIHYGGMGVYKIAILLLNLAPYLALHLVGR